MSIHCPMLQGPTIGSWIECDIDGTEHEEHHAVFGITHIYWDEYQVK